MERLIRETWLGMSVRAGNHRREPVTELMMGLSKRKHMSELESLFGLDVFGSTCPTAGFMIRHPEVYKHRCQPGERSCHRRQDIA